MKAWSWQFFEYTLTRLSLDRVKRKDIDFSSDYPPKHPLARMRSSGIQGDEVRRCSLDSSEENKKSDAA